MDKLMLLLLRLTTSPRPMIQHDEDDACFGRTASVERPDDGTENAATDKDDDDDRNVVTARNEARFIINRIVGRGVVIVDAKEECNKVPTQSDSLEMDPCSGNAWLSAIPSVQKKNCVCR
jgi:hypothetical protein